MHKNHRRIPLQDILDRDLFKPLNLFRRHVERTRVPHHQPGIFAGTVGGEIGVGHIHPHPPIVRQRAQPFGDQGTLLSDVLNQRFSLRLTLHDFANQPNTVLQPQRIGPIFIAQLGVHFARLIGRLAAQRDSHHRNAHPFDLRNHFRRRIVGHKHHLWMQAEQAFNIHRSQIARHWQGCQRRCQPQVVWPQLLFPTAEHADHLRHRIKLHQQVQRLVLQHHGTGNVIGQRDLTVELIGDLAIRQGGGREQRERQHQAREKVKHGSDRLIIVI